MKGYRKIVLVILVLYFGMTFLKVDAKSGEIVVSGQTQTQANQLILDVKVQNSSNQRMEDIDIVPRQIEGFFVERILPATIVESGENQTFRIIYEKEGIDLILVLFILGGGLGIGLAAFLIYRIYQKVDQARSRRGLFFLMLLMILYLGDEEIVMAKEKLSIEEKVEYKGIEYILGADLIYTWEYGSPTQYETLGDIQAAYYLNASGKKVWFVASKEEMTTLLRELLEGLEEEFYIHLNGIEDLPFTDKQAMLNQLMTILDDALAGTYMEGLVKSINYQVTQRGGSKEVGIVLDLIATRQQLVAIDDKIKSLIEENHLREKSSLEAVRFFHDWIIHETNYYQYAQADGSSLNQAGISVHSPYSILEGKESVCQGYASFFTRAMTLLEIENRYVLGYGIGNLYSNERQPHAWNEVVVDGKTYFIDVTFDDPIIGGNINHISWEFYMREDKDMGNTHFESKLP